MFNNVFTSPHSAPVQNLNFLLNDFSENVSKTLKKLEHIQIRVFIVILQNHVWNVVEPFFLKD